MSNQMDKEIYKLYLAYRKAAAALTAKRNELYPEGTRVIAPHIGATVTVKNGSLYADQIYTDRGHMAWTNLEIAKESEDGNA